MNEHYLNAVTEPNTGSQRPPITLEAYAEQMAGLQTSAEQILRAERALLDRIAEVDEDAPGLNALAYEVQCLQAGRRALQNAIEALTNFPDPSAREAREVCIF